MGACREGMSLWFWFGFISNYCGKGKRKWRFPEFVKRRLWRSAYFWQDTFFTPLNRLAGCRLFGHRKIGYDIENGEKEKICFNCYRNFGNGGLYQVFSRHSGNNIGRPALYWKAIKKRDKLNSRGGGGFGIIKEKDRQGPGAGPV